MSSSIEHLIHKNNKASLFTRLAQAVASWTGKPLTFFAAVALIAVWAASGPVFGFNDTWQLVINTSTTIVTFLMVFIIQNSQNRDTAAMQIKLDELIIRLEGAREELLDLEELDEADLSEIRKDFCGRASKARDRAAGQKLRRTASEAPNRRPARGADPAVG
ncbi:low affinity iron permease family protein [Bosea sp. TAF32]|uniref:low affinity iron permease family protein n=1 Tax=Bosea sp. TAF32 TaxID=3237482 RepID=UPI003F8DCA8B